MMRAAGEQGKSKKDKKISAFNLQERILLLIQEDYPHLKDVEETLHAQLLAEAVRRQLVLNADTVPALTEFLTNDETITDVITLEHIHSVIKQIYDKYQFNVSSDYADALDRQDPLSALRDQFIIPKNLGGTEESIYLCGNSLGLCHKDVASSVKDEISKWAELGVRGHFCEQQPWLSYHQQLEPYLASILGAKVNEVAVGNSLSVNLNLLLQSFYRPDGKKCKILMLSNAFPSDMYAIKQLVRSKDGDPDTDIIYLKPRLNEDIIRHEDILSCMRANKDVLALFLLENTSYITGQAFDVAEISAAAHKLGITFGVDLAHATGNVLLKLHEWNVDFAVGCGYKHMSAGPGGGGFLFVHEDKLATNPPMQHGWWSNKESTRFAMEAEIDLEFSAKAWMMSNPPIFSLAAAIPSFKCIATVGMEKLTNKSLLLTAYLEFLLKQLPEGLISLITPSNPLERGSQLSFKVITPLVCENLEETFFEEFGVICDARKERETNNQIIRVAPKPLYNRFSDVYQFMQRFALLLLQYAELTKEQNVALSQYKVSEPVVQDERKCTVDAMRHSGSPLMSRRPTTRASSLTQEGGRATGLNKTGS